MPSFTASSASSNAVWCSWNSGGTSATTSAGGTRNTWVGVDAGTATSSGSVWQVWVSGDSTEYVQPSGNGTIWATWIVSSGASSVKRQAYQIQQLTEEEKAARKAQAEKEAREKAEADARANELLETHLTEEQRRQLKELDAFIVDLKSKQYRIRRGWTGNVEEIKDGMIVARLCIHPRDQVPYGDHMLAQKLMLETNEAEFLRIANRTPLAAPMPLAN